MRKGQRALLCFASKSEDAQRCVLNMSLLCFAKIGRVCALLCRSSFEAWPRCKWCGGGDIVQVQHVKSTLLLVAMTQLPAQPPVELTVQFASNSRSRAK